jgi:hypothetical protein
MIDAAPALAKHHFFQVFNKKSVEFVILVLD